MSQSILAPIGLHDFMQTRHLLVCCLREAVWQVYHKENLQNTLVELARSLACRWTSFLLSSTCFVLQWRA